MGKRGVLFRLILSLFWASLLFCEELPRPSSQNRLLFSMTYSLNGSAEEIAAIKGLFGKGIYTPLYFSHFHALNLAWGAESQPYATSMTVFRNTVDQLCAKALSEGVGLHMTLLFGMARSPSFYNAAKQEDLRNAQWYNDNRLATQAQLGAGASPNEYVFTTPSRYARRLRENFRAKTLGAFAYLKEKAASFSSTFPLIISGPGEAELNFNRVNDTSPFQSGFCDYSPFAVLEFRDWITHQGLYGAGESFDGQGWSGGGAKYQGDQGLALFNTDFSTSFTSWELRYFRWSLSEGPTEGALPWSLYNPATGLIPTEEAYLLEGGFDPPRTPRAKGEDPFWDLWMEFREALIAHYVADIVGWVKESDFPMENFSTHQIPGDYLFGSKPSDSLLNPRYYTSASPLSTAYTPDGPAAGITLYDVNFGTFYARTSQYVLEAMASGGRPWTALEYNPEVIPTVNGTPLTTEADPDAILAQMVRLHGAGPSMISFFSWNDLPDWAFKGTNKGIALQNFFSSVRDVGRAPLNTRYTPPEVRNVAGVYQGDGSLSLSWSSTIWSDLGHLWGDWGEFSLHRIYRGPGPDFTLSQATLVGETVESLYSVASPGAWYYKVLSVNKSGQEGPLSSTWAGSQSPYLKVDKTLVERVWVKGTSSPAPESVTVSNLAGGTLAWQVTGAPSWLSVTPTGASAPGAFSVAFLPSALSPGSYQAVLTVTSGGSLNSPQSVTVSLRVVDSSGLALSKGSLAFGVTPGTKTSSQSVLLSGASLWTARSSSSWLSVTPGSGDGPAVLTVSVNPEGLAPGSYTGSVTVEDLYAPGSPVTLNVSLRVYAANKSTKPFGSFDTPATASTVRSSIPVTGWALDDLEVVSVKVYREEGSGLAYVADALFIDGARPDVEAAYSGYPLNSRGGWGVMLLTNFLPYGDGVYKIHALAVDKEGNTTDLGTKTITVDNAHAAEPFGAIDTPAQGETVSGKGYVNFGWALTPSPYLVPTDGHTINVWVDGAPLGHPVYNNYRQDIADLFPGYGNSNGAVGYFFLDTTKYADGLHSIAWSVVDDGGRETGVGSRYFRIQNALSPGARWVSSPVQVASGSFRRGATARIFRGYRPVEAAGRREPDGGLRIVVGINEPLRLELGTPGTYSGRQRVGDEFRPLPVGSRLDSERGLFTWLPGPGFLGEYRLEFLSSQGELFQVVVEVSPERNEKEEVVCP